MRPYAAALVLLLAAGCGGGGGHDDGATQVSERLWVAATAADDTSALPSTTLLSSDDLGATWHASFTTDQLLSALAFADRDHGVAAGDGLIVRTTDGGAHWSTARAIHGEQLGDVAFANGTHGIAVGGTVADDGLSGTPLVLETIDGGAAWQAVTLPPQSEGDLNQLFGVCFIAADTALAVGSMSSGRALAFQGNANGWTDVSDRFAQSLYAIDCGADGEIWIVTLGGSLLHSNDGGLTFVAATAAVDKPGLYVTTVAFSDAAHGWLAGAFPVQVTPHTAVPSPLLLRTVDGGRSWNEAPLPPGASYIGIFHALTSSLDGVETFAGGAIDSTSSAPAIRAGNDGLHALTLPPGFSAVRAATFVAHQ